MIIPLERNLQWCEKKTRIYGMLLIYFYFNNTIEETNFVKWTFFLAFKVISEMLIKFIAKIDKIHEKMTHSTSISLFNQYPTDVNVFEFTLPSFILRIDCFSLNKIVFLIGIIFYCYLQFIISSRKCCHTNRLSDLKTVLTYLCQHGAWEV